MGEEVNPRNTEQKELDQLIDEYAYLVKRIAYHLLARLPSFICIDDLLQSGMEGLLSAARRFDVSKGASFETYASIRIRGSIVDEMRKGDWAPRSVHRNSRRVSQAIKNIENRTAREATDLEIAKELDVSTREYYDMLQDTTGTRLFSFDEILNESGEKISDRVSSEAPNPIDCLNSADLKQKLSDAVTELPEREKLVMALYYDEELCLKEIGEILGVSESRVSQLHTQAALRLRTRLENYRQWQ